MTTTIPVKPVVKVLVEAKKLLEEGRWLQHELFDHKGGYCALGAILGVDSASDLKVKHQAVRALAEVIDYRVSTWSSEERIVGWNNSQERTKEEILDGLDRAIAAEMLK